jgi:hypothetical protein
MFCSTSVFIYLFIYLFCLEVNTWVKWKPAEMENYLIYWGPLTLLTRYELLQKQ